jgi:hypothetical protein
VSWDSDALRIPATAYAPTLAVIASANELTMKLNLTTLIIVSTGAFFYWSVSGYRGTFNDRMSRYYDAGTRYEKNYWTGLGVLFFIVIIILGIVSR